MSTSNPSQPLTKRTPARPAAPSVEIVRPVKLLPHEAGPQRFFLPPMTDVIWGPLTPYLADPQVNEILVNDHTKIMVNRVDQSHLELVKTAFPTAAAYCNWVDWLRSRLGAKKREPIHNILLPGGIILTIITINKEPMLSLRLPLLYSRSLAQLVADGFLPAAMADYLLAAARAGESILLAGGVMVGKTTLLRALLAELPGTSAIVERSTELMGEELDESRIRRFGTGPDDSTEKALGLAMKAGCNRLIFGDAQDWTTSLVAEYAASGHQVLSTVHASSATLAQVRLESLISFDRDMAARPSAQTKNLANYSFGLIVGIARQPGPTEAGRRFVREIIRTHYQKENEVIFNAPPPPSS